VRALVGAELLKLCTRTTVGLLVATAALVALTVTVNVPKVSATHAPVTLEESGVLAGVVGIGFGVPEVLVVLLGSLVFTQEFRYGTVTATYLGEPRRDRILSAKWIGVSLASLLVTIATLVVSVPVSITVISQRGGDVTLGTQFWETVGAAMLVMMAYGVIGVAVGALVRNQIAAIVGVLVWMLVVEQIVVPTYPRLGRWLPGGATYAWLQIGPALHLGGHLLPTLAGGCLLLAYTTAAIALARVLTPRRDVL
jgi:ABC-2 type transport system permease protein